MKLFKMLVAALGLFAAMVMPTHATTPDAMRCVQNQVTAAGFDAGTPDGLMGAKTRRAVQAYEKANGEVSKRPINQRFALVYCRLIALQNPDLKRFWPQNAGKLNIVFGDSMMSEDQKDQDFTIQMTLKIYRGYQLIREFLEVDLPGPVNVFVAGNVEEALTLIRTQANFYPDNDFKQGLVKNYKRENRVSGVSFSNGILLTRIGDTQIGSEIDVESLMFTIIHELFHQYQKQLSGNPPYNSPAQYLSKYGPIWMAEGSANLIAEHLTFGGVIREFQDLMISQLNGTVRDLQSVNDVYAAKTLKADIYKIGTIAVGDLIPNGDYTKLVRFYEELGRTDDWKIAFETVFGISQEDFYATFLERRW